MSGFWNCGEFRTWDSLEVSQNHIASCLQTRSIPIRDMCAAPLFQRPISKGWSPHSSYITNTSALVQERLIHTLWKMDVSCWWSSGISPWGWRPIFTCHGPSASWQEVEVSGTHSWISFLIFCCGASKSSCLSTQSNRPKTTVLQIRIALLIQVWHHCISKLNSI